MQSKARDNRAAEKPFAHASVEYRGKKTLTRNHHYEQKSSDKNDNPFPELPGELNLPDNIDRRTFLIRNAVIGAYR